MSLPSGLSSRIILATVFPFLLLACSKKESVVGVDQIIGSGKIVVQDRSVGTYDGIQVTSFARVFVTQGQTESLTIEADDNIIERVTTSVRNGVLAVGLQEGSYSNFTLNVRASMKTVRLLESTGAADFTTTSPIQADTLVCKLTGAGSFSIEGTVIYESVEITGAGNAHNYGLQSSLCFASISGTGNVEVNASLRLDAIITGTGTISYKGNPPVVHQTITGTGSVRRTL